MSQPIRVALDLDGVLTEHPAPLAHAANLQFDLDLPDTAFVDSAGFDITDEVRAWVYGERGPASALVAASGASAFVAALIERLGPDRVVIITARPEAAGKMTRRWLAEQGIEQVEVHFADDKVKLAQQLGITHAVEDSLRHSSSYQAAGIAAFLLHCPAHLAPHGSGQAVRDFDAILDAFSERSELPMQRPTIVISDVIDPDAHAHLSDNAEVIDVNGTDREALLAAVEHADALVVRSETQVDADLMRQASALRVVARAGVGVDNIDLDAATQSGVMVLNAPGANSVSAGEHTIAIMLNIARQLNLANTSMHAGKWERKKFKIFDLKGKTIGIVGLGRVGRVVASRLKAFDAHVIAHDPYVSADRFRDLGVERVNYPELLATSDIVTYHVPLTPETHHYLDRDAVRQLKRGAVVINCARGEVIDHDALAEALDDGRVLAAGIDVFPEEPLMSSPFWGRPNVILTPHIGGSSREAQAAVGEIISSSVLAALNGESVPNAVNLPAAEIEPSTSRRLTQTAAAAGHLLSVLEPAMPSAFSLNAHGNVSDEVSELIYTAALSGGLQQWAPGRVTPVNARLAATEAGISQHLSRFNRPEGTDVAFQFGVENGDEHRVTVRWSKEEIGIFSIDGFSLGQPLAGDLLITHHQDIPGVVGKIGMLLGQHGINIAGMQLGRHERGADALMVLNVDDPISPELLSEIKAATGIANAYVVSLPVVSA